MHTHVFLSLGKEIDEIAEKAIIAEFRKHNLRINRSDKPSGIEKIGFKIHRRVGDIEAFEECVKRLVTQLSYLYIVAPEKCLVRLKHHPRIKCYDVSFIRDPSAGACNLINYAYHGVPL